MAASNIAKAAAKICSRRKTSPPQALFYFNDIMGEEL